MQTLKEQMPGIADAGFTAVWLPPPSDAVSAQGYLPRDYYNINSKYGTEAELRELLAVMHENGVKAIADIVINHRCAHFQVHAMAYCVATSLMQTANLSFFSLLLLADNLREPQAQSDVGAGCLASPVHAQVHTL